MKIAEKIILVIVFLVGNGLLIFFGHNTQDFNNISIMGILGFDVTILVSVYLVQCLIDKRRKAEYIVRILDSVAKDFEDISLFSHEDKQKAVTKQTYILNRLYYVKEAVPNHVKSDADLIYKKFEETHEHFDDHPDLKFDDIFYIKAKSCILGKIAKVQLNMFNFDVKEN